MNRIADSGAASAAWTGQQAPPQIKPAQATESAAPDVDATQRPAQVAQVETDASANVKDGETAVLTAESGRQLVDKLNDSVSHQDLEFSVDQDTGSTVITVTSRNTGEVVRQIPSEEVLNMMQELRGQTPASVESARIFDQLA